MLFRYNKCNSDAGEKLTGLKMVFVCEDKTEEIEQQLTLLADMVFEELEKENLIAFLK